MIFRRTCLVISLSILSGCQTLPLSGNGTGTDAGEAKVIGMALLPGNVPASNVSVSLRKQQYIPFSVPLFEQKRTITGQSGGFTLDKIAPGYYLIELCGSDSLCAMKRFFIPKNGRTIDLGGIVIDALAAFSGNVFENGSPAAGSRLLVMGMDKSMDVATDGSFSLHLPSGPQLLRIERGTGLVGEFLWSEQEFGDTLELSGTASTLFEDFNRLDGTNNLNTLLGGGWWFSYTDSARGGMSRILPDSGLGLPGAIDTTANAYAGGSLHIIYQIDSLFRTPYALVGVDICESKDSSSIGRSWFDLRKMSAITFMAKGSGTVYLQFTSNYTGPTATHLFPFEVPFELTPEWKQYVITAAAIPATVIPNTSITVPWSSGAALINDINFLAKKSAELWIDDIIIEGMTPADFLQN
ncbi:MAG: hypothetical protein JXA71_08530 [Chitinispirillaceae bacterium]|nr:hypothetical protein [Chitinispirillaceae bacterium]